jgi:hypothetical protein
MNKKFFILVLSVIVLCFLFTPHAGAKEVSQAYAEIIMPVYVSENISYIDTIYPEYYTKKLLSHHKDIIKVLDDSKCEYSYRYVFEKNNKGMNSWTTLNWLATPLSSIKADLSASIEKIHELSGMKISSSDYERIQEVFNGYNSIPLDNYLKAHINFLKNYPLSNDPELRKIDIDLIQKELEKINQTQLLWAKYQIMLPRLFGKSTIIDKYQANFNDYQMNLDEFLNAKVQAPSKIQEITDRLFNSHIKIVQDCTGDFVLDLSKELNNKKVDKVKVAKRITDFRTVIILISNPEKIPEELVKMGAVKMNGEIMENYMDKTQIKDSELRDALIELTTNPFLGEMKIMDYVNKKFSEI